MIGWKLWLEFYRIINFRITVFYSQVGNFASVTLFWIPLLLFNENLRTYVRRYDNQLGLLLVCTSSGPSPTPHRVFAGEIPLISRAACFNKSLRIVCTSRFFNEAHHLEEKIILVKFQHIPFLSICTYSTVLESIMYCKGPYRTTIRNIFTDVSFIRTVYTCGYIRQ